MMTLKDILNEVLSQSSFLQKASFNNAGDPDDIQMVSCANRAVDHVVNYYPWQRLRKSVDLTMITDQLIYDLPSDFQYYLPDTMWIASGIRPVIIPTEDNLWAYIKASQTAITRTYYGKFMDGKLEFTAVKGGDVINYDYMSDSPIKSVGGTPKSRFTADTDVWQMDDQSLIDGTAAYWKAQKEIQTAAFDMQAFNRGLKMLIPRDTGAKNIRPNRWNGYRSPPYSSKYQW